MSEDGDIAERILAKVARRAKPVVSRPRPIILQRIVVGTVLVTLAWAATVWLSAPVWLLYVAIAWAVLITSSGIYLSWRLAKLTEALKALEAKAASFTDRDSQ